MMKKLLGFLFFIMILSFSYGQLSIEGTYQGENLFVQNPMDDDGLGYCSTEVSLNGKVIMDSIALNIGAFEIDLKSQNLTPGDPVFITIKHQDGCKPKVLLKDFCSIPRSTFKVIFIEISDEGILNWKTVDERGKLPYTIEQYRWNKWINVGEISSNGKIDTNSYEFKIVPHSGENKFRITQVDFLSDKHISDEITFISKTPKVEYSVNIENKTIDFTAETRYELYDSYGSIIKKGVVKSIDCSNIINGIYFLNFDNQNVKIKWKVEK